MRKPVWAILLLALAARLAYALVFPPQPRGAVMANPDNYVQLATSVMDSSSLLNREGKPSAEREPLYPLLLGTAFAFLGKSYASALALNLLLAAGGLLLMMRVGRTLFGEEAALLAGIIAAVYPPFLFYCAQPMRETCMAFIGAASLAALLAALKKGGAKAWAGAGAVNGLAALTNTTFLPFGLFLAPAVLFFLRRKAALLWITSYLAAYSAAYLPWPIRNQLVFGRTIIGSTAGGASTFYTYLHVPQEHGGTPQQDAWSQSDPVTRAAPAGDPAATEQYFWKQSLGWIKEHPAAYVRLVSWRLFVDMWRIAPRPRAYSHDFSKLRLVSWATDGWIIPLGLIGMLLYRAAKPESLWVYGFVWGTAFTYALIFSMLRYRLSLMPWVILFASHALWTGYKKWAPR